VPIEVRRFGVGHRRPEGPPGTVGIDGQVIASGVSGVIAELAFGRRARIATHSNPHSTYFIVIEGGGWVGVGEERTRVLAGEAVVWPPNVPHTAWTDGAPMRAIIVELPEPQLALPGAVTGEAHRVGPDDTGDADRAPARGEGRLASRPVDAFRRSGDPDAAEGEPL
jgi:quercetin dioxygenase-like cupin family protein